MKTIIKIFILIIRIIIEIFTFIIRTIIYIVLAIKKRFTLFCVTLLILSILFLILRPRFTGTSKIDYGKPGPVIINMNQPAACQQTEEKGDGISFAFVQKGNFIVVAVPASTSYDIKFFPTQEQMNAFNKATFSLQEVKSHSIQIFKVTSDTFVMMKGTDFGCNIENEISLEARINKIRTDKKREIFRNAEAVNKDVPY